MVERRLNCDFSLNLFKIVILFEFTLLHDLESDDEVS